MKSAATLGQIPYIGLNLRAFLLRTVGICSAVAAIAGCNGSAIETSALPVLGYFPDVQGELGGNGDAQGSCIADTDCLALATTPCSQAVCEPASHHCVVIPRADHAACDDGEPCSSESMCLGGACVVHKDTNCSDTNPCTADACTPGTGCTHTADNAAACNDGNPCTVADHCDAGACQGGENLCACGSDADCTKISSGNVCSGGLVCTAGQCVSDGSGPKDCDDKNPCTIDGCSFNGCSHTQSPLSLACDDGNICTPDDHCQAGACTSSFTLTCPGGTGCASACDPKLGCSAPPVDGATCDDGSACTEGDQCAGGLCVGKPSCGCAVDADCPAPPACQGTALCVAGICTLDVAKAVPCSQSGIAACTENICTAVGCSVTPAPQGVLCQDGACGAASQCNGSGTCSGAGAKDCNDANPCTVDACDQVKGCTHAAVEGDLACDDGDPCTTNQACSGGVCKGGTPTCSDGNPCTGDLCDAGLPSLCWYTLLTDGHACLDGDPCRAGGTCQANQCVGGIVQDCNDANPCTVDQCVAATGGAGPGCSHVAVDAPIACDDGDFCTQGDLCAGAICKGADSGCACKQDSDCAAFDDGNLCNGSKKCVDHACVVDPGTIVTCPLPLSACVTATCAPNTGICSEAPVGQVGGTPVGCEDGNLCTTGDQCQNGTCLPGTPTDCNDANPCTSDNCIAEAGCAHLPWEVTAGIPCDDGNLCTQGDVCGPAGCQAGVSTCQCQVDADCAAVDDQDLCNGQLVCQGNACVSNGNVVTCPASGSACLSSVCLPDSGTCVTATVTDGTACSDAAGCSTGGQCQSGTCLGAIAGCDDLNGCTIDACGTEGCTHLPTAGTPCDDGEPCTSNDACDQSGQCTAGPNTCACTTDVDCPSDGDLCNGVYACNAGGCLPKPGSVVVCDATGNNGCQTNTCGPTTGICLFVGLPNGATCEDGNACTTAGSCQQGSCDGTALVCDDSNPCTDDGCSPAAGCFHLNSQKVCDDGNPCSLGDQCSGGACIPGAGACECANDVDCTDDGNLCNGIPTCVAGKCTVTSATVVLCDPSKNTSCTVQVCDSVDGVCKATAVPDNTACDDASVCSLQDRCVGGACTGTSASCDDQNACSTDTCDPVTGCANTANALPCDDGEVCTTGDTCAGGVCTAGVNTCTVCTLDSDCADDGDLCNGTPSCQAGLCKQNPGSVVVCAGPSGCQTQTCVPATGLCNALPAANGTACDDGSVCTASSACFGGACVGNLTANCDDNNGCTADTCDPKAGCLHSPASGACDDGNPCTSGDACGGGQCLSGGNTCQCVVDGDCAKFEDGNACNGTLRCAANQCVIKAGTVVTCNAVQDSACVKTVCAPQTGVCAPTASADGTGCSDGSLCTVSDACAGGICQGQALNCNDANPCTVDACDATQGCVHKAGDGATCDDGNGCTTGDVCAAGLCKGSGTCQCQIDADCGSFEDGNVCNGTLRCQANQCVVNPATIISCGTSPDACTVTTCEPTSGKCLASSAQDGSPCGGTALCGGSGTCKAGTCSGTSGCADDGNPCTTASCDGKGGCTQNAISGPCSDGSSCTVGDACVAGACVPGANQCNCAVDSDCAKLDDGNLCNGLWTCNSGQCAPNAATVVTCPASPNTCTTSVCQPLSGKCEAGSAPNGTACDDGNACTGTGQCFAGNCLVGQIGCDDANPCTTDSCNVATGCVHVNLGNFPPNTCDDGDPCTPISICQNGKCNGPFNNCFCQNDSQCQDDGNLCNGKPTCQGGTCKTNPSTVITCSSSGDSDCIKNVCQTALGICGPSLVPAGTACSDGSTCTGGDVCSGGSCIGITTDCNDNVACTTDACDVNLGCVHAVDNAACEDGNSCTTDTCDAVGGCGHAPALGAACNDGSLCTTGEVCGVNAGGGICQGGTTVNCDDGNLCTTDACDAKNGCSHTPNADPCDDGSLCTSGDACGGGTCQGNKIACDDTNACTADFCDPKIGCQSSPTTQPCDDGNPCTSGDACSPSGCLGPVVTDCNDGDICTVDACVGDATCKHGILAGNACDDANACTVGDTCHPDGGCSGGASVNCNDGNACTVETCLPVDGSCDITGTAAGSPCSDGQACTAPDACDGAGACTATTIDCNDNNDCTVDACDASTGSCTHTPLSGFSATFDNGTFGGIATQSLNPQESWVLDTFRAVSGSTSLYIGTTLFPGFYTYNVGPNAASATLPSISVPKDIASATLTFQLYYDRDPSEAQTCTGFVDSIAVSVDGAIGTQVCENTGGFVTVKVDLTGKAGSATAIAINFVANNSANNGQGAWIDDVTVAWQCKP